MSILTVVASEMQHIDGVTNGLGNFLNVLIILMMLGIAIMIMSAFWNARFDKMIILAIFGVGLMGFLFLNPFDTLRDLGADTAAEAVGHPATSPVDDDATTGALIPGDADTSDTEEPAGAPVEESPATSDADATENHGSTILMVLGSMAVVGLMAFGVVYAISRKNANAEERRKRAADREKAMASWKQYETLHEELNAKVWEAETDWDILFYYPAINDPSISETREMRYAMDEASRMDASPPSDLTLSTDIPNLPYPKTVTKFQRAWDTAWQNAKIIHQSNLTVEERKTIDQIMHLLQRTKDVGTTDSEKQLAFERIDKLVSSLTNITVPERAKEVLAAQQVRALESRGADVMDSVLHDQVMSQYEHVERSTHG